MDGGCRSVGAGETIQSVDDMSGLLGSPTEDAQIPG